MGMSDLLSLLTQSQPKVATGQALLILDVQKEFTTPTGILPVKGFSQDFAKKLETVVEEFRKSGDVIWADSIYRTERPVNDKYGQCDRVVLSRPSESDTGDGEKKSYSRKPSSARVQNALRRAKAKDEGNDAVSSITSHVEIPTENREKRDSELFLSGDASKHGSEFGGPGSLHRDPKDQKVGKSYYSAFKETALLLSLRTRFVTKLYLCGCFANLSVYATAVDAARHGFNIYILEDCIVSRTEARHDEALKQMVDLMGATKVHSTSILGEIHLESSNDDRQDLMAKNSANEVYVERERNADGNELPRLMQSVDLNEDGTKLRERGNGDTVVGKFGVGFANKEYMTTQRIEPEAETHKAENSLKQPPTIKDITTPTPTEVTKKPEHAESRNPSGMANLTSLVDLSAETDDSVADADVSKFDQPSPAESHEIGSHRTVPVQFHPALRSSENTNSASRMNTSGSTPTAPQDQSFGEGDSSIIFDLISPEQPDPYDSSSKLTDTIFSRLYDEVRWQKMYHMQGEVPRLVAVQGEIEEDGSMPIYRHPTDQSPPLLHFSPTVQLIREELQKKVKQPVNHVLIQLYRSGNDYISEHSDKTLDIVRGSSILNVSFGAQRVMRLRTKKPLKEEPEAPDQNTVPKERIAQKIPMPHNSMFVLGEESNARWLHGISQDKRLPHDRSEEEMAYAGSRISLTFRNVGTYLDADGRYIWGQGATCKSIEEKKKTINGDEKMAEMMIRAFSQENRSSTFDWDRVYGPGFDILHLYSDPPHLPMLFLSGDSAGDLAIRMCLAELGIVYETIESPAMGPAPTSSSTADATKSNGNSTSTEPSHPLRREACYRDADTHHSEVVGLTSILLYLDRYHHVGEKSKDSGSTANAGRLPTARAYTYLFPPYSYIANLSGILGAAEGTSATSATSTTTSAANLFNIPSTSSSPIGSATAATATPRAVAERILKAWNFELRDGRAFAAGTRFTVADCTLWAGLHWYQQQQQKEQAGEGLSRMDEFPMLKSYYEKLSGRESVKGVVESEG